MLLGLGKGKRQYDKREFIKKTAFLSSLPFLPSPLWASKKSKRLKTAFIGVGGMQGLFDLQSIASHKDVDVVALCDVDETELSKAHKIFPDAEIFSDYRNEIINEFK